MDVSIVIVSWNCKDHLKKCIESILSSESKLQLEIIVVDNNSMDGTCEVIQEDFPNVILIENDHNAGFATGCNIGIQASRGRIVMLLNPDTTVSKGVIDKMVGFIKSRNDVGMLGPREVLPDGTFDPACCRTLPSLFTHFLNLSGLAMKYPDSKLVSLHLTGNRNPYQQKECEAISGSCMVLKREVLNKIGLLDERFFMYGEDMDLCFRVKKAGWKIWYYAEAEIMHVGGESSKLVEDRMRIVSIDSVYKYVAKNRGMLYAIIYSTMLLSFSLFWLSLWFSAYCLGYKKRTIKKEVIPKYIKRVHWAIKKGCLISKTKSAN